MIELGSRWIDKKNNHHVIVLSIKNNRVTLFDETKKRKRQRPVSCYWFNKNNNKGFIKND